MLVRRGQGMQVSFESPVRSHEGFLASSIAALDAAIARQEKQAGSLYGKKAEFTFGRAENEISIDELAEGLASFVKPFEVQA